MMPLARLVCILVLSLRINMQCVVLEASVITRHQSRRRACAKDRTRKKTGSVSKTVELGNGGSRHNCALPSTNRQGGELKSVRDHTVTIKALCAVVQLMKHSL